MKSKLIDFFKGIPIGASNVVPGFSGGTMAVILNIYERFINAFSDFFHQPIKVIKDVWALVLGIVVGVIIAIKVISLLLMNFPIPTTMFFVGLIIGSIPKIIEKANNKKKTKAWDVIIFFVCISVVITLPFIGNGEAADNLVFNLNTSILIIFLAIIASATMVIPGVSGSMILLAIGYYDYIWVDIFGAFTNALSSFDFQLIIKTFVPVIPFAIGVVVGLVLISKLIKLLMKKHPETVYYAILGLLFASPFAIMFEMYGDSKYEIANTTWIGWVIGFITLAVGAYSINYLGKFEGEKRNEQTEKD